MHLLGILEGILFVVGDEGISFDKLKMVLELSDSELQSLLNQLKERYCDCERGLQIEILGNLYKLVTKKEHKDFYEKLVESEKRETLSQAALETLAVIAYNEPVTRSYVDEIRGVDSAHMIRKLLFRNLIREVGRSDLPGKPILYGVTPEFLDYLGLSSTADLPKMEEIISNEDADETDLYDSKYKE